MKLTEHADTLLTSDIEPQCEEQIRRMLAALESKMNSETWLEVESLVWFAVAMGAEAGVIRGLRFMKDPLSFMLEPDLSEDNVNVTFAAMLQQMEQQP